MPVVEQTLAGVVDFDGDTVGTGLVLLSALKVRPERIILLSVYYVSASDVKNLILKISPPDRPADRIEMRFLEILRPPDDSTILFEGRYLIPKLDDNRNFDLRFETFDKKGEGTVGFDFIYKAF